MANQSQSYFMTGDKPLDTYDQYSFSNEHLRNILSDERMVQNWLLELYFILLVGFVPYCGFICVTG